MRVSGAPRFVGVLVRSVRAGLVAVGRVSAEATGALPVADDSERQVLAALMSGDLPGKLVAEVTATLTPASFRRSLHRDTYATILELIAGDQRPDVLLVVDAMGRRGLLKGSRSAMDVRDIGAELLIATNAPVHARRIAEAAERTTPRDAHGAAGRRGRSRRARLALTGCSAARGAGGGTWRPTAANLRRG